ncbi:hypothetical protein [Amycolatopsis jiangsuensis]|uniref:Uncharacterized protein n=1 Tax=Amycolatopsis jiangsuensis TaxID=1181879 RepID=A0A840J0X0_9PSEU|nr:hypothetical protein [Amycolatopsis jiangsuensis]MBB4687285.1 hypothetical protein [Amycolatopsis jiangsuensis]
MTNVAAHESRGATRARRFASRALFVLGGAVAATAAAWVVSGASASAATAEPDSGDTVSASITPVTDATVAGLDDATRGVSRFTGQVAGAAAGAAQELSACGQSATTWSEPGTSRPDCALDIHGARDAERTTADHEVSGRVSDAVADLGENAVLRPVQRGLGSLEHIVRKPADTKQVITEATTPSPAAQEFGRKIWALLDPGQTGNLVDLPGLPVVPVQPDDAGSAVTGAPGEAEQNLGAAAMSTSDALQSVFPAGGAVRTDVPSGSSGVPSQDGHHGDLPGAPFSPAQLPVAPPSIPTTPGGSGSTAPGGHLDGLNLGVPTWVTAAVDNAVAGMSRGAVRHTPFTPGEQPGVTPD